MPTPAAAVLLHLPFPNAPAHSFLPSPHLHSYPTLEPITTVPPSHPVPTRPTPLAPRPPGPAANYEAHAGRYWDLFYKRNEDRFFKDRHYLDKEWPQLAAGPATLLEVRWAGGWRRWAGRRGRPCCWKCGGGSGRLAAQAPQGS